MLMLDISIPMNSWKSSETKNIYVPFDSDIKNCILQKEIVHSNITVFADFKKAAQKLEIKFMTIKLLLLSRRKLMTCGAVSSKEGKRAFRNIVKRLITEPDGQRKFTTLDVLVLDRFGVSHKNHESRVKVHENLAGLLVRVDIRNLLKYMSGEYLNLNPSWRLLLPFLHISENQTFEFSMVWVRKRYVTFSRLIRRRLQNWIVNTSDENWMQV